MTRPKVSASKSEALWPLEHLFPHTSGFVLEFSCEAHLPCSSLSLLSVGHVWVLVIFSLSLSHTLPPPPLFQARFPPICCLRCCRFTYPEPRSPLPVPLLIDLVSMISLHSPSDRHTDVFSHFGTSMSFFLFPFIQKIMKCSTGGTEVDCTGKGGLEVAFLQEVLEFLFPLFLLGVQLRVGGGWRGLGVRTE